MSTADHESVTDVTVPFSAVAEISAPVARRVVFCFASSKDDMNAERFNSAYRLAIGIVLLYVLWMLIPNVMSYTQLVVGTARHSQKDAAQRHKLSAANLESALRQAKQFGPNSQLRCEPASRDWDYVCRYMPTPLQSPTWLTFGVDVDATRWVKVSRVVPLGTILPPPQ